MARRSGSTIQEELYSTADGPAREELDDARLLDLDAEKESPFLRAQKRVSARRGPLPKKTAARLLWAILAIVVAALGSIAAAALYHYGEHSWRFRLQSSDVDLTDPEDVKTLTNDPDGEVLVHLGSSDYLDRFKVFVAHLREWRQQFEKLESVDLRYDRHIVVNPDLRGTARQPAISAAA